MSCGDIRYKSGCGGKVAIFAMALGSLGSNPSCKTSNHRQQVEQPPNIKSYTASPDVPASKADMQRLDFDSRMDEAVVLADLYLGTLAEEEEKE